MNRKIGLILVSTFLFMTLFNTPLTFAQYWDSVKVSAYGTNVIENNLGGASLEFIVVAPPSGSEISNTISGHHIESNENYTANLSPGDSVLMTFANMVVESYTLEAASEPNHFIIYFEGQTGWLWVNGNDVPEFSPILIAPMFITATLLSLIYRRKRTSAINNE